jgi:hypothetical protein
MQKRTFASIAVSALAILGLACGGGDDNGSSSEPAGDAPAASAPADSPKAANTTVAVGQAASIDWGNGSKTTITVSDLQVGAKGRFGTAKNGQYITVKVTVVQVAGTYHSNPFSWKFVLPDGSAFDATLPTRDPGLNAADLDPVNLKQSAGYVTFDVPAGAQAGGKVAVSEPGLSSGFGAYWTTG